MSSKPNVGPCNPACTRVIKFMTGQDVPAGVGIDLGRYSGINGYRYINIFVEFSQTAADEEPVDLGIMFAFDADGTMGSRRYVNLEQALSGPQGTNMISVSGQGSWHGSQHNVSRYVARLPVMGPFILVIVYNRAPVERKVSVWGYLVS